MEATQVEYISKEAAAEILGIKPRSVLAMAERGKLRTKLEIDSSTNQMVKRIHAGDVERVKYERDHPEEAAAAQAGDGEHAGHGEHGANVEPVQALQSMPAGELVTAALAALLAHKPAANGPVLTKALTVDEAAAARGLAPATILRMIHAGVLPAIQDAPIRRDGEKRARPGSSWRIFPEDLAALRGSAQKVVPAAVQAMHAV